MLRSEMRGIMYLAWQMVRENGFSISEALRIAWANHKLQETMKTKIVKFYYRKVTGEIREAFGSLKAELLPEPKEGGRKPNNSVFIYFDTEKYEYRSFKRANLLLIA